MLEIHNVCCSKVELLSLLEVDQLRVAIEMRRRYSNPFPHFAAVVVGFENSSWRSKVGTCC